MMKTVAAFCVFVTTVTAFAPVTPLHSASQLASSATDSFSKAEKEQIIENVFECHGFFPDMREENELPAEVIAMRAQPKPADELAAIKEKYSSMSEADAAFAMLVDLGLMENYDLLGEYSDDFADDAM
jgi:hypothetical protein